MPRAADVFALLRLIGSPMRRPAGTAPARAACLMAGLFINRLRRRELLAENVQRVVHPALARVHAGRHRDLFETGENAFTHPKALRIVVFEGDKYLFHAGIIGIPPENASEFHEEFASFS